MIIQKDVDECELGLHSCDRTAACHNNDGSYVCGCGPGFLQQTFSYLTLCEGRYYDDNNNNNNNNNTIIIIIIILFDYMINNCILYILLYYSYIIIIIIIILLIYLYIYI